MKVLIVDDSPDALRLAEARLATEDVEVSCAGGGREGLAAARRERPDLILLDVRMPDLSGFDVCRTLKSDSDLCSIPVIFLSGSGGPADKVRGLDLGAVDYVTKPFDAFELQARVRAALRTKRLQDLLAERAQIDPLTGLSNRRGLTTHLAQEWARHSRHGCPLCCVMADVDHFKQVNDTHGHNVGDRLLQAVANAVAGECRRVDLPARYGGDEFAVILPEAMAAGGVRFAERCRDRIRQIPPCLPGRPAATASFGVADATDVQSPEGMIAQADGRLYEAKQAGRDAVVGPPCALSGGAAGNP